MLTQRQLFLQHVAQTSDAPLGLEIEKAEGVYLYDVAGKKYIDLISGIGVSALGHGHPWLGRGRGWHESGRCPHTDHPGSPRLWGPRRRRRDSAERHAEI